MSSPARSSSIGRVRPSASSTGVSGSRQYAHAWVQPRNGLIVHRNGIRDASGTRLRIDLARTS
jgi:hypothetical protein